MALKVNSDDENSKESTEEIEDEDDEIAMLLRCIKTLIRRKKNFSSNNKDKKKMVPTCSKCKKPGHIQFECTEKKQEDSKKYQNYFERRGSNNKRFDRKKRAMLAWDVIEDVVFGESSDADQEEQHDAQISLRNEEYPNGISFMVIHDDEHRVPVLHLPQTGCRRAPLRRGSDRPIGPIQMNGGSVFISDPARSDVRLILSSSLTAAHGRKKSSKLIPIGYGVGQPRRKQHIAFISRSMAKPNMPGSMSVSVFIPSQPIRPARYPQVRRAAISVINGSNASRLQRINSSTRSQTSKADAQIVQATISVTIMDGSVGHSEQSTDDPEQVAASPY
ncbi:hypothetical protein ACLOJK_022821 [Asimina triloba]